MDSNNSFDQNLLNLIENSRFKRDRPQNERKRKDLPIRIAYEDVNVQTEAPKKLSNTLSYNYMTNRFELIYTAMKDMRKELNAPVDIIGCYTNPDPNAPKEVQNYQLLISMILSVQTKDQAVSKAMNNLIKSGLTLDEIHRMDEETLKSCIHCVNFSNNKAKYIKGVTDKLVNKYHRKIPDSIDELVKLPGIGRSTAVLFLNYSTGKECGIGVDVHIHRICNRLELVNTKAPEKTQAELESFVPKQYWSEMNDIFVGFGQQICTPTNPKCQECTLNNICPTGKIQLEHKNPLKKIKKDSNIVKREENIETTTNKEHLKNDKETTKLDYFDNIVSIPEESERYEIIKANSETQSGLKEGKEEDIRE